MRDICLIASDKTAHLEVAVAVTTEVCRQAHRAHGLGTTSTIGLGRLLTAAGLVALTSKRPGTTSLQVMSKGPISQLYADATEAGEVRGYSRKPFLAFPLKASEAHTARASIGAMVLPGNLSVVRSNKAREYVQSAAPLTSGEVDRDVESFLVQSEQVPSVVACETLLEDDGGVRVAAGALIRAMPDGDLATLYAMRDRLVDGALAELLNVTDDVKTILAHVAPDAEVVEDVAKIVWKCRCSMERVVAALELLGPEDLAEMADADEPAKIDCDFCSAHYEVPPQKVLAIFTSKIQAQG